MSQQPESTASPRAYWPELDLLRGLAILLMVLNHVGVVCADMEPSQAFNASVFIGSFAPTLFFFVTGIGAGIQSAGPSTWSRWFGILEKVVILIAADSMIWLPKGSLFRIDFFGFIGLSMLLLSFFRPIRRGEFLTFPLAILVVAARYGLASIVRESSDSGLAGTLIAELSGVQISQGTSYPPCPWLFYPLIGFTIGRVVSRYRVELDRHRSRIWTAMVVLAVGFSAMAWLMSGNRVIFRYGSMSIGYFVASLGVLSAIIALALVVGRKSSLEGIWKLISLSGVRSFAVVPIHYALVSICMNVLGSPTVAGEYFRNVAIVYTLSMIISAAIPWVASQMAKHAQVARRLIIAMAVAAIIGFVTRVIPASLGLAISTVVQLGLCLLFSLQSPRSRSSQPTANSPRETVASTLATA